MILKNSAPGIQEFENAPFIFFLKTIFDAYFNGNSNFRFINCIALTTKEGWWNVWMLFMQVTITFAILAGM